MILPRVCLEAGHREGLLSAQELADSVEGRLDGMRSGIVLAGVPQHDVAMNATYARNIAAALYDRDVIGA
jgi:hypothetical protein